MKQVFFLLLFLYSSSVVAQDSLLPQRIIFNYYYGGDYRNDTLRGVLEIKDSVVYICNVDKKYYDRKAVTYLKRILRVFSKPERWYILSDTPIIEDYRHSINSFYVNLLVEELDTSLYNISAFDSISNNGKKEPIFQALPKDFSLDYYMIDSLYFGCLCEYYKKRLDRDIDFLSTKKCVEGVPLNNLLDALIKTEHSYQIVSSYRFSLGISLEYDDYTLHLSRSNMDVFPATRWVVYNTKTEESYHIINSKINEIMTYIFAKQDWKTQFQLKNYKNPEELYRFYLGDTN